MTYEHLRVMLDDTNALECLADAAEAFARAELPTEVSSAFVLARMAALQKDDGGVRGIAAGASLRRLVARALARQVGGAIEHACAPFQFALSTRAGTDVVGHAIRLATDADPEATVGSIDGIGAYDNIWRKSMLAKLESLPGAREILPFILLSYGRPSEYCWTDDEGTERTVTQGEGGEQGDPPDATPVCTRNPRRAGRGGKAPPAWRTPVCLPGRRVCGR